jgi:hypothetical protein
MAATVAGFFCGLTGTAAAGISEFQVRRAGIPVAGGTRNFFVLLAAGTGVQDSGFVLVAGFSGISGFWLCIVWHWFTNRTVAVR